MTKLVAYKSNDLVEAGYRLTLQEQRLLLLCISKLQPRDDMELKPIEVTAAEFFNCFPAMGHGNAERHLKEAVENLWERTICIRSRKKKTFFRWIDVRIEYIDGSGKVEILFSAQIKPYLLQLKEKFTKIALRYVSNMSSIYSMRMYELLQQFRQIGNRLLTIKDLHDIFDLRDKYPVFKDFSRRILLPALKEINEKTDINVSMITIRKGRCINAVNFVFNEKAET